MTAATCDHSAPRTTRRSPQPRVSKHVGLSQHSGAGHKSNTQDCSVRYHLSVVPNDDATGTAHWMVPAIGDALIHGQCGRYVLGHLLSTSSPARSNDRTASALDHPRRLATASIAARDSGFIRTASSAVLRLSAVPRRTSGSTWLVTAAPYYLRCTSVQHAGLDRHERNHQ